MPCLSFCNIETSYVLHDDEQNTIHYWSTPPFCRHNTCTLWVMNKQEEVLDNLYRVADMEKPEEHPPCTPAPYHSARGLELPEWSAGFKLSSPTFSRATPARTPWHLGPPQVMPHFSFSTQNNVWNAIAQQAKVTRSSPVWLNVLMKAVCFCDLTVLLVWLQRTPQAQRPALKTPALQSFGRTPYTGVQGSVHESQGEMLLQCALSCFLCDG